MSIFRIYLLFIVRERAGGEEEGKRESQADSPLGAEPDPMILRL